jgi:4-hydroxythreonine-4-phosphate dehydrogenase
MTGRWLILADDLTGADDCAVAFAKRGLGTAVSWGTDGDTDATVLAIDVDSRALSASEAAARHVAAQSAHWRHGMRLYKKIDSTLRGQPAAELAAQLAALAIGQQRPPIAIVAPAFPAAGRQVLNGRIVVDQLPLEETALWGRDRTYQSASLPEVLACAGLSAEVIALDAVRAGTESVLARMHDAARRGIAAVVCDSATRDDLAIVAAASLRLEEPVWVGSAGLAGALAAETDSRASRRQMPALDGPVLVVVGSPAERARRQARNLADSDMVVPVTAPPDILLAGSQAPPWKTARTAIAEAFARGRDVLLEIGPQAFEPQHSAAVATALAELVAEVAPAVGAFVITGGQTARTLLSRLDVHGIRLIDEVEPGVPLGVTSGRLCVPVITKAGAFGDDETLRRCLARLTSSTNAGSR